MSKAVENKAKKIKLIATDIDGVWTDSKMYYTDSGEYMKGFSTYDGMATSLLKKNNIEVAILTSEKSNIVKERAKKLNIKYVYINEKEKLLRMEYLCNRLGISLSEVAYIGDGLVDIPVMEKVGVSFTVPNAHQMVKDVADHMTSRSGGNGAFREVVDFILKEKGIFKKVHAKMKKNIYKSND